jgi:protein-S-isoprenylcysteine O-methyltransferase Ste14
MRLPFTDIVALAALVLWPAIPLFWIPVHCFPRFFRRVGFFTYVLPFITWLPVALITYSLRDVLLSLRTELPSIVHIIGALIFILGAGLQTWTLALLSLPVIMGMPEVTKSVPDKLVTTGPFAVVRHPTYLSHTLMLLGLFLWTSVSALGIVTLFDTLVINIAVIPLEERELLERYGNEYEIYRRKVTSRLLPLRRQGKRTA